jgi:integrase
MAGWQWVKLDKKAPRIVTPGEEAKLLDAAEAAYGLQMRAFVYVALNTGGRRGELTGLTWDRVDFDGERVHFAHTKGKRDRFVPFNPDVASILRRVQAMTLKDGGPFVGLGSALDTRWKRVRSKAGVADVTIHDLRRTYITRLIRAGVPLPTVQRLAGHEDIKTTLDYYTWVSDDDLRAGVAKLRTAQAAG